MLVRRAVCSSTKDNTGVLEATPRNFLCPCEGNGTVQGRALPGILRSSTHIEQILNTVQDSYGS
jgi:hypothetical protein